MLFKKFIVTSFILALLSAASDAQVTPPVQVTSIEWTFPPEVTSTLWSPATQVVTTTTRATFTKVTPPVTTTTRATFTKVTPPAQATPIGGKTVAVYSKTDFCLFLPPVCGQGGIAANGHKSIPFCTKPLNYRYSAKPFPTDFIRTAHFRSNTQRGWVQVTGRIRRQKYCLKGSDQGGQSDRWHPPGASCSMYPHFVEFVEPNENIYCIRCCKIASDCPINRATEGCRAVIRGNYS
ncbi:hypothetical protein BGZ81_010265 [Podila clonocystis]|nr:hypothetical protein BGZ81_010265 [Podila clonocystis]